MKNGVLSQDSRLEWLETVRLHSSAFTKQVPPRQPRAVACTRRAVSKPRARLFRLMSDGGARQDLGRLGGPREGGYDRRAREIHAAWPWEDPPLMVDL